MGAYDISQIRDRLFGNTYVGRGIIIGMTPDGCKAAMAYFIMGRSENSRNRVFTVKGGEVATNPYDLSKVKDPSLIIYRAVRQFGNKLIITNGDQTDTIYDFISRGETFAKALNTREFEPDAPNFTPRISGMITFSNGFSYEMSILKSADPEGTACVRENFSYPAIKGLGHFLHTYARDGAPIPSFTGEPERIAIPAGIDEFTDEIWDNLDIDNRVSLCTRYIDLSSLEYEERLINRNERGNVI